MKRIKLAETEAPEHADFDSDAFIEARVDTDTCEMTMDLVSMGGEWRTLLTFDIYNVDYVNMLVAFAEHKEGRKAIRQFMLNRVSELENKGD